MTAALALAAGSALTASGERDGAWAIAAVAGAGALAAARGLSPACGLALLALAPAGALRAAGDAPVRVEPAAAPDGAPATPFTGKLRRAAGATTFGDERWRLAADAPSLELPPGLVREGELAAISATARALLPATGPFTDERSRRPLALMPRADEVVRLGPAPVGAAAHRNSHLDATERASAAAPPTSLPASLLARVTAELEAARAKGLERIAAAGRAATDDEDETTEVDAPPIAATPESVAPTGVPLPHAGLLAALLLGASEDVDFEVGEHFTRTGTRHIVSLSGLHFALVAWLIGRPLANSAHSLLRSLCAALVWLARRLGARPPSELGVRGTVRSAARLLTSPSALLAAGAFAFVPLAGNGAPAARAAVALALASLADLVGPGAARGRRPDALTLWSTALLLELLARPSAVLAVGVQLSYAATLALIVAYRPTVTLLRALVPGGGHLAPVDRHGRRRAALWRVPSERLLGTALGALAAGLVATLATLPITWARFGEWSPLGIVATPLVMPFVTGALAGGYAWLLAPELAPLSLPAWSLELLVRTLAWCDTLPTTPLVLPIVSTDRLVLSAAGALAALVFAGRRPDPVTASSGTTGIDGSAARGASRARGLALCAAAAAVLAPMRRTAEAPRGLELIACDVGRGRAFLLRAPSLGVWLIDGGSSDRAGVARRALLPVLRAWGAEEIGVVLTSEARAHGSALPWLVERFDVHTWAGAAPDAVGVPAPQILGGLRVDCDEGAVQLHRADAGCELTLVRAGGTARTVVVRAGGHTLWILGDGLQDSALELLARGLLTSPEPGDGPPRPANADGAGQRLLVWPSGGVGRASGALLDALSPRLVWLAPPLPQDVPAELERRGVPSALLATPGGLALECAEPARRAPSDPRAELDVSRL